MHRLILTAEQFQQLSTANGIVDVVDSRGQSVGHLTLMDQSQTETQVISPDVLADLRRHNKESALEKGPAFKSRKVHDNA